GAKGLAWFKVKKDKDKLTLASSISKFFDSDQLDKIIEIFDAKDDDLLLFVAADGKTANKALGPLRCRLARELNLYDPACFQFVWVVDFPLFEWNEDTKRFDSLHHPFTAPSW
ncbi:MAG: GAD domain-containing protein, partial [Planctomycetota bacterium]